LSHMMRRSPLLFVGLMLFAFAAESDQQITDFSLSGYGEKGKKSWDICGKTADIFTEVVRLKDITGNMYGKDEDVKLTADEGAFNKDNGSVHLEQNVVVTTTSGTRLTTDSLDWDRKMQLLTTPDNVNIQRQDMVVDAVGAKGQTNLKKVALEKNVRVDIKPENPKAGDKDKIVITCDGPLEIDYAKNIATFNNNVRVEREDSIIYSDTMDVYFLPGSRGTNPKEPEKSPGIMGSKIDRIVARGNVKIVRGQNVSYSEEAVYTASDSKITLNGSPKLVIYSTGEKGSEPFGN
jgi:LPS export ABC transporter protein LptC